MHAAAVRRVDAIARVRGWTVRSRAAMPMPPLPTRWSGIVVTPEGTRQIWFDLFSGTLDDRFWPGGPSSAEWERVPATRDGRVFLWFARFPVARRSGEALILSDARFHLPAGWPQRHPFDLVVDGKGPRFASADDR